MHSIQQKLIKLSGDCDFSEMKLRQIGELIGEEHPQKIKHHIEQLRKRGLIKIDKKTGATEKIKRGLIKKTGFFNIPILGSANCGDATIFADENFEGFLKISGKLLIKRGGVFAIRAEGSSMNRANIKGMSIEDGDYVIIDSKNKTPNNGDYVLSIIDDVANIKKFVFDKKNNQIVLTSESNKNFPPIYIHPKDFSKYIIGGRVIQIIKKPKLKWAG